MPSLYINLSVALTDYVTCDDDSFVESNRINPISQTDVCAIERNGYQLFVFYQV